MGNMTQDQEARWAAMHADIVAAGERKFRKVMEDLHGSMSVPAAWGIANEARNVVIADMMTRCSLLISEGAR